MALIPVILPTLDQPGGFRECPQKYWAPELDREGLRATARKAPGRLQSDRDPCRPIGGGNSPYSGPSLVLAGDPLVSVDGSSTELGRHFAIDAI